MWIYYFVFFFFFSSRRRHTRCGRDWSSDGALPILEGRLQQVFAAEEGEVSLAALKQELRDLIDERDQLLADLEAERSRVRRLKAANEEVSGRLEAVKIGRASCRERVWKPLGAVEPQ